MTRLVSAIAASLLLLPAAAQAQTPCSIPAYPVYGRGVIVAPYHAATAEESIARGRAALHWAQAQGNVLNAQAAIYQAEAQRRNIDNRVARTEAHFRMRDINRQARFGKQPSSGRLSAASGSRTGTNSVRPEPQQAADRASGPIQWPPVLQQARLAGYRQVVERLVNQRYHNGGLTAQEQVTLTRATRAMTHELNRRRHECSPEEYAEAQRLLNALAS